MPQAVEEIAREMTAPMFLDAIVREACRRARRPPTKSTPASVQDTLDQLPFVILCGQGLYGPARVLLDRKALRVRLSPSAREHNRLSSSQLEPFYSALEKPPVETADGRLLEPSRLSEEKSREDEDAEKTGPGRTNTVFFDLKPVLEGLPESEDVDLVVRWEYDRGALVVEARPRGQDDPGRMAVEDKLLADYLVSRLVEGNPPSAGPLVLEAYAHFEALGLYPGSPVLDVIRRDPRLRIIGDDTDNVRAVKIAHARCPTHHAEPRTNKRATPRLRRAL